MDARSAAVGMRPPSGSYPGPPAEAERRSPESLLFLAENLGQPLVVDDNEDAAAGFHAHLVKPVDLDALNRLLLEAGRP